MCLPDSCVATSAARIHRERRLQYLFYSCVTSQRTWRVPLLRVYGPLPSNGCISASTVLALSKYATLFSHLPLGWSRISQLVWQQAKGWKAGVPFPGMICLFSITSRPALGPTQPPVQWVPEAVSPGVKLTTHVHQCRGQEWWTYTSTHPYVFMPWCLIN
jgi:hypothetical protein